MEENSQYVLHDNTVTHTTLYNQSGKVSTYSKSSSGIHSSRTTNNNVVLCVTVLPQNTY